MKNKNQIIIAHIGGRSGSIGFPENKHFEHEIQNIISNFGNIKKLKL